VPPGWPGGGGGAASLRGALPVGDVLFPGGPLLQPDARPPVARRRPRELRAGRGADPGLASPLLSSSFSLGLSCVVWEWGPRPRAGGPRSLRSAYTGLLLASGALPRGGAFAGVGGVRCGCAATLDSSNCASWRFSRYLRWGPLCGGHAGPLPHRRPRAISTTPYSSPCRFVVLAPLFLVLSPTPPLRPPPAASRGAGFLLFWALGSRYAFPVPPSPVGARGVRPSGSIPHHCDCYFPLIAHLALILGPHGVAFLFPFRSWCLPTARPRGAGRIPWILSVTGVFRFLTGRFRRWARRIPAFCHPHPYLMPIVVRLFLHHLIGVPRRPPFTSFR